MSDDDFVFFLIMIQIVSLYLYFRFDKKKKEREQRERREHYARIAKKKRDEEQRKHLSPMRQSELDKPLPQHMRSALSQITAEASANSTRFKWHELSPLACFGYRVGKTNGLPEKTRREIIYYTWYAKIPGIIPTEYAAQWGMPGTYKRYSKICSHLTMLAEQRQGRPNFEVAIKHWKADLNWFTGKHAELAANYRRYGFDE